MSLTYKYDTNKKAATIDYSALTKGDKLIPVFIKFKTAKYFVTNFLKNSFQSLKSIKSVQIPPDSKIVSIGDYAFYDSSIESITITPHISKIGHGAFGKCEKLKRVIILSFSN